MRTFIVLAGSFALAAVLFWAKEHAVAPMPQAVAKPRPAAEVKAPVAQTHDNDVSRARAEASRRVDEILAGSAERAKEEDAKASEEVAGRMRLTETLLAAEKEAAAILRSTPIAAPARNGFIATGGRQEFLPGYVDRGPGPVTIINTGIGTWMATDSNGNSRTISRTGTGVFMIGE